MGYKFKQTLLLIAHLFNQHKLNWAVGASTMLMLKKIDIIAHDIDLMISEDCFEEAYRLLKPYYEEIEVETSALFKTRYFKRFKINDIEIDLMSGMSIISDDELFEYRYIDYDILFILDHVNIPLCYIEDWFLFYHLMPNRLNTINLIKEYDNVYPLNMNRLNKLMVLNIPHSVYQSIHVWIIQRDQSKLMK